MLLQSPLLFILLFLATSLAAQDNYKKFLHFSYAELDSLVMIPYQKGDYQNCLEYAQAGRAKAKAAFGTQDSTYAEYTCNMGFFYDMMGQYPAAELYYLEAKSIQAKVLGINHPTYAVTLNNLANTYESMDNYTQAEPLYLESINIIARSEGKQHPNYPKALQNLAYLYSNMDKTGQAEKLYLEAIAIRAEILGEEHPSYATSLNNLAVLYRNISKNAAAEKLHLKAKSIRAKVLGKDHPSYATSLDNLGMLYQDMKKYNQAKSLFREAIEIDAHALGFENPLYATSLNNLAGVYLETNSIDTSIQLYTAAMAANSAQIDSNFSDWASLDTIHFYSYQQATRSIKGILGAFKAKYNQSKDKQLLEMISEITHAALRFYERIRNGFSNEDDKLRSLAESSKFAMVGINTAVLLQNEEALKNAFRFAELSMGVLLLDAVKSEKAYTFGDLPDTLVQKEKQLQKRQISLEAALLEKQSKEEKEKLYIVLNELNQEIDAFNKEIKIKYPKYIAIKYENKIANLTDIQALLDDRTAILEFISDKEILYIFCITHKQFFLYPEPIYSDSLKKNISILHNALSNYSMIQYGTEGLQQNYTYTAHWFYLNILKKSLENLKNINHLIILPDRELAHLPFETFLVEKPKKDQGYTDLHYLLNDYKISYNYSASLWKENRETNRNKNNGQLFAMAANYTGQVDSLRSSLRLLTYNRLRQQLQALPAAREEVEQLSKSFNGFFGFDNNASEKIFKEKVGEYAIIHLAMHGLLDEKHPILSSLAFTEDGDSVENNFLQAYEISKMELNADLVVLSACETGFGKFEVGNGTASLARAFMYAGVPSLVVSLWQVNDASTSAIMQSFYQNLAKGMSKDEALGNAKLEYLKKTEGLAAHPAFWSPFILMGNTEPITLTTKGSSFLLWGAIGAGGLLVLGAAAFALRKGKTKPL